jgi:predicted Zn-dependent peptidase
MTNAATSHDYAHFYLTTSADQIEHTLPHLAEILLHAEIDDEEFYREKDVVLEELRACYDDPDWIAYQTLCGSIYQNHPYGRSILGNQPCLEQLTPNQMRCFHRTYYQPKNMCVAIIGGIEPQPALEIIRQSFREFPVPSESPPHLLVAEPPLIEIRRSQVYLPHLEHSRLLMGWMGPGCESPRRCLWIRLDFCNSCRGTLFAVQCDSCGKKRKSSSILTVIFPCNEIPVSLPSVLAYLAHKPRQLKLLSVNISNICTIIPSPRRITPHSTVIS